jgi:hypothetical protein
MGSNQSGKFTFGVSVSNIKAVFEQFSVFWFFFAKMMLPSDLTLLTFNLEYQLF